MFKKTLLVATITFVSNTSYATSFAIGDSLSSPAWAFSKINSNEQQNNGGDADQDNGNNGGDADQDNDNDGGDADQDNDNDGGDADQDNDNDGGDTDQDNDNDGGDTDQDNDNDGGDADQDNDNDGGDVDQDNDNDGGDADQDNDNDGGDSERNNESNQYDVTAFGDMTVEVTDCSTVTVTLTHTLADFSIASDSWTLSTSEDLCTNTSVDAQSIKFTDDNGVSFTLKISAEQSLSATLQNFDKKDNKAVFYAPTLLLGSNSTTPFGTGV